MAITTKEQFIAIWTEIDKAYVALPVAAKFGDYDDATPIDATAIPNTDAFFDTLAAFPEFAFTLASAATTVGQVALAVNLAFIKLGDAYVEYLEDNPPILDIAKPRDPGDLGQSYHDNILGNLSDAAISDRFNAPFTGGMDVDVTGDTVNDIVLDPRAPATDAYAGSRPYFSGDSADPATRNAVIAYDQANDLFYAYPDMSLQAVIDAAAASSATDKTVYLAAGEYELGSSTLNVYGGVSLVGLGDDQGDVIIDAQFIDGYGIFFTSEGGTLSNFTLNGPAAGGASGNYGIKAQPDTADPEDTLNDITIDHVTVSGSLRSEIDLNGVNGALISDVIADGNGTGGVGIAITDSSNVELHNVTTIDNAWGSVGLYPSNVYYNLPVDNISFTGTYSHNEATGIYQEDRGVQLICLHHSSGSVGTAVNEINFFNPVLNDSCELQLAKFPHLGVPGSDSLEACLDHAVRMNYGFYATRNRTPVSWMECRRQVVEEYHKLSLVIETLRPQSILLWHQWNSLSEIARLIATQNEIPSAFIHEGMLPRTMTIDSAGMMAEAQCTGALLAGTREKNATALSQARRLISQVAHERLDRKPQLSMHTGALMTAELRNRGKKIIFYAGINDWQSGNLPADHPRAREHSPFFVDTLEALQAVAQAAEMLDAFVVFKPHPNLFPRDIGLSLKRVILLRDTNTIDLIEQTDVTVTLLSSISYISLAHGKPTVLLGRNSLSGTGATYDLTDRDAVEKLLAEALAGTGLKKKLAAYEKHVAALVRDFFYPYGEEMDCLLKGYPDAADHVLSLCKSRAQNVQKAVGAPASTSVN